MKETTEQKVKDVLVSISDWNCRAEGFLSDPDQIPNELGQKIAAVQGLLAEIDEVVFMSICDLEYQLIKSLNKNMLELGLKNLIGSDFQAIYYAFSFRK